MSPAEKMNAALANVTNGTKAPPPPSAPNADVNAEIARLRAENEAIKARLAVREADKTLTMKIGGKGALSVYGLGQFPVTLYPAQWGRLLAKGEEIKAFIARNEREFRGKDESQDNYTARTGRKPQNNKE